MEGIRPMTPAEKFAEEVRENIRNLGGDGELREQSLRWISRSALHRWTYNFAWLGRPIIQFPTDMVAVQEILWNVQPDVVVETGIAHGGSLVYTASILALLDLCDGRPAGDTRRVVGVDIDIRAHNRTEIEKHPLAPRIEMIEGSSIAPETVAAVKDRVRDARSVLVCLDSNHTHEHVHAELEAYAPLVTPGSYCIVFDTVVDDLPEDAFPDRPWGPGNNPKTAVRQFLASHPEFVSDRDIDAKLQISVAPEGYLRRIG